ncbi:MAG TPA: hypothetical protein VJX92_14700 [Methylomirabilota bacterium]|nr:hypothetical protein [Methylomirabilota bacterium]
MRRQLCQVCSGPADKNELGWLWLLENHRGEEPDWPEREVTTHPPVCAPCMPLTLRLCPHMRDAVAVRVGQVVVDGVYGQLYQPGTPLPVRAEKKVVSTDDGQVRWMVGAQLAATLLDVTVVEMPEPGTEAPAARAAGRR